MEQLKTEVNLKWTPHSKLGRNGMIIIEDKKGNVLISMCYKSKKYPDNLNGIVVSGTLWEHDLEKAWD